MIDVKEFNGKRLITLTAPDCDDMDEIKEQLDAAALELTDCQLCGRTKK